MNERLDYVQKLEAQIKSTKDALDKLKAEKKDALVAVQHQEIENLEQYLNEANVSLSDLSIAAEDAWHELREAIENLMTNMNQSLKKLLGDAGDE